MLWAKQIVVKGRYLGHSVIYMKLNIGRNPMFNKHL